MEHLIADGILITGGMLLTVGFLLYSRSQAERWARIALFLVGLAAIISGLVGILLHHNPLGLSESQFLKITSLRSMTGGIAIGIFIALLLSGQFLRLGLGRKKE